MSFGATGSAATQPFLAAGAASSDGETFTIPIGASEPATPNAYEPPVATDTADTADTKSATNTNKTPKPNAGAAAAVTPSAISLAPIASSNAVVVNNEGQVEGSSAVKPDSKSAETELKLLQAKKELVDAETKRTAAETEKLKAAAAASAPISIAPPPAYDDTHSAPPQPINVHVHLSQPTPSAPPANNSAASAPPKNGEDANTTAAAAPNDVAIDVVRPPASVPTVSPNTTSNGDYQSFSVNDGNGKKSDEKKDEKKPLLQNQNKKCYQDKYMKKFLFGTAVLAIGGIIYAVYKAVTGKSSSNDTPPTPGVSPLTASCTTPYQGGAQISICNPTSNPVTIQNDWNAVTNSATNGQTPWGTAAPYQGNFTQTAAAGGNYNWDLALPARTPEGQPYPPVVVAANGGCIMTQANLANTQSTSFACSVVKIDGQNVQIVKAPTAHERTPSTSIIAALANNSIFKRIMDSATKSAHALATQDGGLPHYLPTVTGSDGKKKFVNQHVDNVVQPVGMGVSSTNNNAAIAPPVTTLRLG